MSDHALPELAMRMIGIKKSFDGVVVLKGVDFEVARGEIHALAGGNGAGKSTLMKILQGVYTKDAGQIVVKGREVDLTSIHAAKAAGIGMVFQEFSLVPSLTVAQNIYLTAEPMSRGLIDDREAVRRARQVFTDMDVEVDPRARVSELSTAYWQLTEIAKALAQDAQVLIMDEPTASLARHETEALFELIDRLKARGIAIVYISHRMDEVYRIGIASPSCVTATGCSPSGSPTSPRLRSWRGSSARSSAQRWPTGFAATRRSGRYCSKPRTSTPHPA